MKGLMIGFCLLSAAVNAFCAVVFPGAVVAFNIIVAGLGVFVAGIVWITDL